MISQIPQHELPFDILVTGRFLKDQIKVLWNPEKREYPIELLKYINKTWEKRKHDACLRGVDLFPGQLCRLNGFSLEQGNLILEFQRTDYKELVGTNHEMEYVVGKYGKKYLGDGTGINGPVISRDGFIIVTKRSEKVYEMPGFLDVSGGHINPDVHFKNGRPEPFSAMAEEVRDELNISLDAMHRIICIGLVRHVKTHKPELIFDIEVTLSFEEILKGMGKSCEAYEIERLIPIADSKEKLLHFIDMNHDELSPAGYASLWLHAIAKGYF